MTSDQALHNAIIALEEGDEQMSWYWLFEWWAWDLNNLIIWY